MISLREIEEFVLTEFSALTAEYGFTEPKITRDRFHVKIDYLSNDIAIELQIDKRELVAFLMVVRLENGNLPAGYLVSNGQKCRRYLAEVINEKKWNAPAGPRFDRVTGKDLTPSVLQEKILAYKVQLFACIERVLMEGSHLF